LGVAESGGTARAAGPSLPATHQALGREGTHVSHARMT
jgi:hypothetical protein